MVNSLATIAPTLILPEQSERKYQSCQIYSIQSFCRKHSHEVWHKEGLGHH